MTLLRLRERSFSGSRLLLSFWFKCTTGQFAIVRGRKLIGGRCKMDLRHLGRDTRHDARNRENAGPAEAAARAALTNRHHIRSRLHLLGLLPRPSAASGDRLSQLPRRHGAAFHGQRHGRRIVLCELSHNQFYVRGGAGLADAHLPYILAPDHVGAPRTNQRRRCRLYSSGPPERG